MSNDWIDDEGFRANVGIILTNGEGKLMLGGRVGSGGWQFPQGGMLEGEAPEVAMYRELEEEVGLSEADVELLGVTRDWLRYRLPDMLKLTSPDDRVRFDVGEKPEFDRIRWVDFWRPVNEVIYFKRRVYARALHELGSTAYPNDLPPRPRWWPKRWRAVFDKDIARYENGGEDPG